MVESEPISELCTFEPTFRGLASRPSSDFASFDRGRCQHEGTQAVKGCHSTKR